MRGADIGMLERGRLAGLRVDGECRDIAFAGTEHFHAVDVLDAGSHRGRDARAVAEIDDLAVGVNVNRSGALNRDAMVRIAQGFLGEQRLGVEIAVRLELVDDELALPFDRQIDPRLGRMEVEVPRSKSIAAVRLDLSQVRQYAVIETIYMQRTGIFRLAAFGIVAARDHQHGLVVRCRPDLMEVDALLQIVRLRHLVADAAVGLDPVHADAGREIVGDEDIFAASIDAVVDRPRAQLDHVALWRELAIAADPEGRQIMFVAGKARTAGARGHIEKLPRRARPGILDAAGHLDRAALGQRVGIDVDIKVGELATDTGIERHALRRGLGEGATHGGNAAGQHGGERASAEHGFLPQFYIATI